ncbi:ABC transporter permease [Xanthocytophaga agilis]|uniref:ABC transporter permease n=1 Tax=Xanthocytophaga agilis TaxID=3048010 RepID=A0AAE3UK21_9BACT|nr:ABC transporter permease [Xanthocytophaga agilis]MDJ1506103.1 ABC transporter permease [Xanthocytophaga agilis]
MKLSVNYQIALTHILTRKKQTLVAALGVTVGIALYIFSNSIVVGVSTYSKKSLFKSAPHIRIYSEDQLSLPLATSKHPQQIPVLINPQFANRSRLILNSEELAKDIASLDFVEQVAPYVKVDLFLKNGKTQVKGVADGIVVAEADAMFNIAGTLLAGSVQPISYAPNAIVIGKGIAEKLNLRLNDQVTVVSSEGVSRRLKVVGIFSTDTKDLDDSKAYMHIGTAQKLLRKSPSEITDLYVKVRNPDSAGYFSTQIQQYTKYKVEDWQTSNAEQLAQNKMLGTMTPLISFSILLVAAFGIYNIINMTISQKMNDIAILKANGFNTGDIIKIFVSESLIMGSAGTLAGLLIGTILVTLLRNVYIGPPVGYFPVQLEGGLLISGSAFGMLVSVGAGYFPARKAGKVDPVTIFRK